MPKCNQPFCSKRRQHRVFELVMVVWAALFFRDPMELILIGYHLCRPTGAFSKSRPILPCPGWKPVFRESHKVGNMNVSIIIIIITKIRSGKCKNQRIWTALTLPTTFSCLFERFSWEKNVGQEELLNLQRFGFRLHIRNIRKIWDNLRFPDRPNSLWKHYVSCFRPAVPPRVNLVFSLVQSMMSFAKAGTFIGLFE